jgi:Protein of unknown function (DUF3800)
LLLAYLDEFGHIGPYVSRNDPNYNDSPVFGLAGLTLPDSEVRQFGSWFYQRKCELLRFEIERSGKHAAVWEKKGAALFTTRNIEAYPELTRFTRRFLNRIASSGGNLIYVGVHKTARPGEHRPMQMYSAVLRESMKRLNQFAATKQATLLILVDQHQERDALITEASRAMFNPERPLSQVIEPPVQVESHRYQTLQAADWICGLIGRLRHTEQIGKVLRSFIGHRNSLASRSRGSRSEVVFEDLGPQRSSRASRPQTSGEAECVGGLEWWQWSTGGYACLRKRRFGASFTIKHRL